MYEPDEKPNFDYFRTGYFSYVESEVRHSLGQFKRYAANNYKDRIKIGASNDPDRRWYDHKRGRRWQEMRILWGTSSLKGIRQAEKVFIDYVWDNYDVKCLNEVSGGGGLGKGDYWYLYVLLG